MRKKLDPVITQILWNRLVGITDEASATLTRTSFSSIVRDAHDYANTIFTQQGDLLAANTRGTPGLSGGMTNVLRSAIKKYSIEGIYPDDIFITNDPWIATGHLNDITLGGPFFYNGKLIGFGLSTVHHMDIGGRMATTESRSVYEEGIQIPLCKLAEKGVISEMLLQMIGSNVRGSNMVIGDIRAQMSAINSMAIRTCELLSEYGLNDLDSVSREIISRSDKEMRNHIKEMPDGIYTAEMYVEHKEITKEGKEEDKPIKLQVAVEVKGDEIEIDFEGTSAPVAKAINVVYNFTYNYALFAIICLTCPDIPNNAGTVMSIPVKAPKGCILNCDFPAPVWSRTAIGHLVPELIFRALANAIPERVIAGSGSSPVWVEIMSGEEPKARKQFLVYHIFQGGLGAGATNDGQSCLSFPCNVSNDSMEVIEKDTSSIIFNKKELTCDSAGAGKYRGGFGQEISFSIMSDEYATKKPILFGARGGRFDFRVPGILGGLDAPKARMYLNGKNRRTGTDMLLYPGDTVDAFPQGGGGYGSPLERDLELVETDLRNGLISKDAAKNFYGVIIDEVSGKIDFNATKKNREILSKS